MKSVKPFQFTLNLKNIDQNTPQLEDRLYDASCDDALIHFRNGVVYLDFDREAASLEEAITTAIQDVKSAFVEAEITSVSPVDLVTEAEIAKRLDMTRQMVSLWIKGERRKLFPLPVMRLTEKSLLWSWSEVTEWLYNNGIIKQAELVEHAKLIANVNLVLAEPCQITSEFRQRLRRKIGLYDFQSQGSNKERRLMEPDKSYAITKMDYPIHYEANPRPEDIELLNQGILAEHKLKKEMKPLDFFAFFIRDENKKIVGGCAGDKMYGGFFVGQLWVAKELRGKGYGTALMKEAERLARSSHCQFMTVNTFDWEALDFYQKLGFYVEFARKGFDKDSIFNFLRKDLSD